MGSITPTADLIENILNGITYEGTFKDYTDNGDGTITGATCDTLHARPLGTITIDGADYKVVSVVNGVSITYTGSIPAVQTYTLNPPFYFHGTPTMINQHLTNIVDDRNKFPMVYLLEILRENFDNDPVSAIDRVSDVTLFFMDISRYEQWTTDQHYANAINPMRNLAQSFVDSVNNANGVGKFTNYTIIPWANFGINSIFKGNDTPIFNEKISGVELQVSLPFKRSLFCYC